jgi:hypothetical protein
MPPCASLADLAPSLFPFAPPFFAPGQASALDYVLPWFGELLEMLGLVIAHGLQHEI